MFWIWEDYIVVVASDLPAETVATLAGQVVMEGYLGLRLRPWLRRIVTRAIAIIPAVIVILVAGEEAVGELLVLGHAADRQLLPRSRGDEGLPER